MKFVVDRKQKGLRAGFVFRHVVLIHRAIKVKDDDDDDKLTKPKVINHSFFSFPREESFSAAREEVGDNY